MSATMSTTGDRGAILLARVMGDAVDRLGEGITELLEAAWDEGFAAAGKGGEDETANPYREETPDELH